MKLVLTLILGFFCAALQAKEAHYKVEMRHWVEEMVAAGMVQNQEVPKIQATLKKWKRPQWEKFKRSESQVFFHRPLTYSLRPVHAGRGPASLERKVDFFHQSHRDFEDLSGKVRTILRPD